ncbi:MAG: hypothetical protein U1E25_13805 [Methylocystis sp.]
MAAGIDGRRWFRACGRRRGDRLFLLGMRSAGQRSGENRDGEDAAFEDSPHFRMLTWSPVLG